MSTNNTKQVAWVAIGSFCSFLVGIVSPMILSRYFTKSDYGTYKQVMFVYNTLLTVFTLGLPRAYSYFIPKNPIEQSKAIIIKLTKIFIVLGFVFSCFLFFSARPIASLLKNEELILALRCFSPVPLLLLPTMGLEGVYASFQKTQYLAIYTAITKIFTIICVISPVILFSGGYISAIIGFDIASALSCCIAMAMILYPTKGIQSESSNITYRDILRFAIPLMIASLWGVIFNSANQFFISRYYGSETFADFSNGFMELPFASMIISAVATIMLPVFSRKDSGQGMSDEVLVIWRNTVIKSAKIIFPMLFFCIFFPKLIMTCMYGEMYETSALFFMIRNIGGLFYIVPFAPIILSIGRTKEYSRAQMISAIAIVIMEFMAVKVNGSPVVIAVISEMCRVLVIVLMLKIISSYSGFSIMDLLPAKFVGQIIIPSVFSGFISVLIMNSLSLNKWVLLGGAFAIYVFVYYISCFLCQVSYKEIIMSLFPQVASMTRLIKYIP